MALRSRTPERWSCGVGNCGGDQGELHILTDDPCPLCGYRQVEVKGTGFRFCSNHEFVCDWDHDDQVETATILSAS